MGKGNCPSTMVQDSVEMNASTMEKRDQGDFEERERTRLQTLGRSCSEISKKLSIFWGVGSFEESERWSERRSQMSRQENQFMAIFWGKYFSYMG